MIVTERRRRDSFHRGGIRVSLQTKGAEAPIKSSLSRIHDEAPRRRWASLVVPFVILTIVVAVWRTNPQTWRQLRLATFGGSTSDAVAPKELPSKTEVSFDNAFAGKGEIDVEGGLLKLFPLAYGEIEEVAVRENAQVKVGDVLLRLRNKSGALQIDEAKQLVALAEIDLDKAKRSPDDLEKQMQLAQIAVKSEEKLVGVAQRNLEHL